MRRWGGRAFAAALLAVGCGGADATQPTVVGDGPHDVAVLRIKDLGEIHIELLPELAPRAVENFVKLAGESFYDGTNFHRVIPGFMIQGGDPLSKDRDPRNDGRGGPGYTIKAEFNDISHKRGIVSMARAQDPDSAGSQFFIVVSDQENWKKMLDGQFSVGRFGFRYERAIENAEKMPMAA